MWGQQKLVKLRFNKFIASISELFSFYLVSFSDLKSNSIVLEKIVANYWNTSI